MTCDIRYDSPMMTELATFPPLWPGRAHLRTLADRLDRCARVCWEKQHQGDEGGNPCS